MAYSLNSLKRVLEEIMLGNIVKVIEGDATSLDYGSYQLM